MPSGAVKVVPYAPIWLGSSQAERCDYVTFDPKEERIFTIKHGDRLYNLYAGLQVQPIKGNWDMIKYLFLEGLCAGFVDTFQYVLNWSALAV